MFFLERTELFFCEKVFLNRLLIYQNHFSCFMDSALIKNPQLKSRGFTTSIF